MTTSKKDQLLQRIESSYAAMMALIDSLSPREFELRPGEDEWSARDILAHIAQWEFVLLRFHLEGEDFSSVVGMEGVRYRQTPFEIINQHLFKEQQAHTASEIKSFANQTHRQMVTAVKNLSAEALEAPAANLTAQGYPAEPLRSYIEAITYKHYEEHMKSLRQLANRKQ